MYGRLFTYMFCIPPSDMRKCTHTLKVCGYIFRRNLSVDHSQSISIPNPEVVESAIGYDPEPVLFSSHPHNLPAYLSPI